MEYMKIFYDYLKTGKGRAESLKLAREEMKVKISKPVLLGGFLYCMERDEEYIIITILE